MRYEEIDTLIRRFEESSLSVMEYEESNYRIRLEQKDGSTGSCSGAGSGLEGRSIPQVANESPGTSAGVQKTQGSDHPESDAPVAEIEAIRSPIIGTFYSAPAPEEPAFVREGDIVKRGDVLGIVEAMKVMNEIKAPSDCRITAVRISDGAMVEVGSALFEVEPC